MTAKSGVDNMNTEHRPEIVWSYRLPEHELFSGHFRGEFATRHEAIGHATTFANSLGLSEWEVRGHLPIYEVGRDV